MTERERHAFDYYRSRSAAILDGNVSGSFWSGLVLRLTVSEPAVRHAVLALSSLHEYASLEDVPHAADRRMSNWRFAFREYGKAMSAMREWKPKDEHDPGALPLLVCVLFVCIEFLAAQWNAAQLHICQGRKILSQIQDIARPTSPARDMVKRELVPIYARLGLSSFLFGTRPESIPGHLKLPGPVPAEFSSLDEATQRLYQITDETLKATTSPEKSVVHSPNPDPTIVAKLQARQQHALRELARWHSAFTLFCLRSHPTSPQKHQQHQQLRFEAARDLLLIYYHAAIIWATTWLRPDETAYDAHIAQFSAIISLSSSLIQSRRAMGTAGEHFSFESEITGPLYWTAVKCRHALLRREAVKLLLREEVRNLRECLWRGGYRSAKIAIRVIEMEEDAGELFQKKSYLPGAMFPRQPVAPVLPPEDLQVPITEHPGIPPMQPDVTQIRDYSSIQDTDTDTPSPVSSFDTSSNTEQNTTTTTTTSTPTPKDSKPVDLLPAPPAILIPDSPFGIPEHRRVKNVLIDMNPGPDGQWVSVFTHPADGEAAWRITREFVEV